MCRRRGHEPGVPIRIDRAVRKCPPGSRVNDVLVHVVLVLVTAGMACVLVGPARAFMMRRGVVDSPNHRSSHHTVTPRGGGLACLAAVVLGSVAAVLAGAEVEWVGLLAAVVLALLGLADDHLRLPALPRLGGQLLVGGATGWYLGGPVWALIGAGVTVVLVNAVNFMDGINGITALTMAVWGAGSIVVGLMESVEELAVIGSLTAGAAIGFLPWNAPNARIFLGDVGSYLFGGLAAAGVLVAGTSAPPGEARQSAVVPVVAALSVYLVDVFVTIARRAVRRAPLLEAHREHVYQLAASRLGDHLPVSIGVAGLSGAVAVVAIVAPLTLTLFVVVVVAALYLCVPALLGRRAGRLERVRREVR